MGGRGLKGHTHMQNYHGCGGRVVGGGGLRSFWLVLLFAFASGVATFGVMNLHKLRERQTFNLILRDRDLRLNSLQLHFQEERKYAKQAKRKSEEIKEKLYSNSNQLMELKARILEMQSTISSLKEENRAMELALDEKENEIKLMTEKKLHANRPNDYKTAGNHQLITQRQSEFEELTHNLDLPDKVWSVSTNDPSNPPVNLTTNLVDTHGNKADFSENKEYSVGLHKVNTYCRDNNTSIRDADRRRNKSISNGGENVIPGENRRETSGQGFGHETIIYENGAHGSQGISTGVFHDNTSLGIVTQKIMTIVQFGVDKKPRHEDGNEKRDPKRATKRMFGGTRAFGGNYEGSMKLELPEKSNSGESHRSRRTRAMIRGVQGKKWRTLAEKRLTEINGKFKTNEFASRREKKYSKDDSRNERKKGIGKEELQRYIGEKDTVSALNIKLDTNEDKKLQLSNEILHRKGLKSKIYMQENKNERASSIIMKGDEKEEGSSKKVKEAAVFSEVKLWEPKHPRDAERGHTRVGNLVINGTYRVSEESYRSPAEVQLNNNINAEVSGVVTNDKQKPNGIVQPEEHVDGLLQHERNDINAKSSYSKPTHAADKNKKLEDLEVENRHEYYMHIIT